MTYPYKQCAAVTTHWSATRVPPQKCPRSLRRLTCQGHSPSKAASPPTIRRRGSSLCVSTRVISPHLSVPRNQFVQTEPHERTYHWKQNFLWISEEKILLAWARGLFFLPWYVGYSSYLVTWAIRLTWLHGSFILPGYVGYSSYLGTWVIHLTWVRGFGISGSRGRFTAGSIFIASQSVHVYVPTTLVM